MKSPGKPSGSATSRALAREVRTFCERNSLTPRESEILALLVEGVVRIKDVAVKLKLSPNTVNNHVNSIFMKTKTRSKSQVLAELLGSVAEELQTARAFRRSPRAVVYDQDVQIGANLSKELKAHGFKTCVIAALDRLESAIAEFGPDCVIVDSMALQSSPRELIERIQAACPACTIFVGPGPRVGTIWEAMDAGAIEWLPRPLDVASLASRIAVHLIEDDGERTKWYEREAGEFKTLSQIVNATSENLGRGGVLLSSRDIAAALGTSPTAGDWLEFKMTLDKTGEPYSARGQVVWQTAERTGVRFSYLPQGAREGLATFLRQHSVRSYIPCGAH